MRSAFLIIGALWLIPAAATAQTPAPRPDSGSVTTRATKPAAVKPAEKVPAAGRLQRALTLSGSPIDSALAKARAEKQARRGP